MVIFSCAKAQKSVKKVLKYSLGTTPLENVYIQTKVSKRKFIIFVSFCAFKEKFILNSDVDFPCIIHYQNVLPDINLFNNIDKIYFIDTCFILYLNKVIDIGYLFLNVYKIFDTLPTDINLIDKYFYVYQIFFININNLFNIFTEQKKTNLLSILIEYLNKFYLKKLQTLLFVSNNPSLLYRENYINYLLILFTKYLDIKKYIDASNEIFNFYYDKNLSNN